MQLPSARHCDRPLTCVRIPSLYNSWLSSFQKAKESQGAGWGLGLGLSPKGR